MLLRLTLPDTSSIFTPVPTNARTTGLLSAVLVVTPTETTPPEPVTRSASANAPTISAFTVTLSAARICVWAPMNAWVVPFAFDSASRTPSPSPPPAPAIAVVLPNCVDFALRLMSPVASIFVRRAPGVADPDGPMNASTSASTRLSPRPPPTPASPMPIVVTRLEAVAVPTAFTVTLPAVTSAPSPTFDRVLPRISARATMMPIATAPSAAVGGDRGLVVGRRRHQDIAGGEQRDAVADLGADVGRVRVLPMFTTVTPAEPANSPPASAMPIGSPST